MIYVECGLPEISKKVKIRENWKILEAAANNVSHDIKFEIVKNFCYNYYTKEKENHL